MERVKVLILSKFHKVFHYVGQLGFSMQNTTRVTPEQLGVIPEKLVEAHYIAHVLETCDS